MTTSTNESKKPHQERSFKVVLFTFPPVKHVYNISPFAVKVESYLRINDIPFEMVYTTKFGPKGKIPYVHIIHQKNTTTIKNSNGGGGDDDDDDDHNASNEEVVEVIPDSNVILSKLEKLISPNSKDMEANLSLEEKATAHAINRMMDEHTAQIGFYYRYTIAMKEFMQELDVKNYVFNADKSRKGAFVGYMFGRMMPKFFPKKMKMRGLATHSNDELWEFSNDDILALSNYLADKKYFLGREFPTSIDCTLFGHLSQFLYIPIDFPQKKFMKENCPNLILFMDRFKTNYWSDWEEKCERKVNQSLAPVDGDKVTADNRSKKVIALGSVMIVVTAIYIAMRPKE